MRSAKIGSGTARPMPTTIHEPRNGSRNASARAEEGNEGAAEAIAISIGKPRALGIPTCSGSERWSYRVVQGVRVEAWCTLGKECGQMARAKVVLALLALVILL